MMIALLGWSSGKYGTCGCDFGLDLDSGLDLDLGSDLDLDFDGRVVLASGGGASAAG